MEFPRLIDLDYLWWEQNGNNVPILALLDFSAAFNIINHGMFGGWFQELGIVAQSYAGSSSSRTGAIGIDWEMPQCLVLSPILFNIYMNIY